MTKRDLKTAILVLTCPDRKGLVAAIADFLLRHGANILHADQHQDAEHGLFLMRVEWDRRECDLSRDQFAHAFRDVADRFGMEWRLQYSEDRPRLAIFVSRYDHCLADLLHRHHTGEFRCEIPLVVSNHPETRELAGFYNVPFHWLEIDPERKEEVERRQLDLLAANSIDVVVLARYMQILSPDFVRAYRHRIINIHHSFLPAFLGAKPYHRAFERGVKLIGATSHYVTEDLDDGPIIEQDVTRISHRDSVEDLVQKGRDLEKIVLSRAVRWHLESRTVIYANKTVVFD